MHQERSETNGYGSNGRNALLLTTKVSYWLKDKIWNHCCTEARFMGNE